jgi:F-type H+-transporting ATPase subunit b
MLLAFGVVFAVLYKYGFPVITSMIDAREKYIDDALKEAKEANERIADIEEQCNGLVEEARQKQMEILREATAAREQIIKEAREKADAETAKIIAEAKREIERQREDAMNAVREEAAKVAVAVAEKILRRELSSPQSQEEYIARLVDETRDELKAKEGK